MKDGDILSFKGHIRTSTYREWNFHIAAWHLPEHVAASTAPDVREQQPGTTNQVCFDSQLLAAELLTPSQICKTTSEKGNKGWQTSQYDINLTRHRDLK